MKEKMILPIKQNELLEVEILDINHKGQGIAKKDGFVIFVDNAVTGDLAEIEIIQVKKKYGVGKINKMIKESEYRKKPECKYFHKCGGCQIMNINYEQQLIFKKQRVVNELKKTAGIKDIHVHDTIGMKNPFRYRNKGAFPVVKSNNKIAIGAYEIGTHKIVDIDSCIIQNENADKIIRAFKIIMQLFKLEPYDEMTNKGLIKHLMIRTNKKNEVMIIIVTSKEKLLYKNEIVNMLIKEIPQIKSVIQNINKNQTNVILGNKNKILYGEKDIKDTIFYLEFSISPHSFFQVNSTQTEILYDKVIQYANLTGKETVFDIYCGIGTISLMLAQKAKMVYGIEIVEQAIIDAKQNAKTNNIKNIEFHSGKAEHIFPKLYNKGITADIIVIDPPRKGCEKEVIETILNMQPQKVVYVSCNPVTLARDLKMLHENGFEIKEVQPVDMFPHGTHVEAVTLLTK